MPSHVWVDFGLSYTGPTFFPLDPSRCGWIPIQPVTVSGDVVDADCSILDGFGMVLQVTRRQLPLYWAWAWTVWKTQGQTWNLGGTVESESATADL
jgi:hypothetical protein